MVSVDMIGWRSGGAYSDQAWIYGRPEMGPIRNDLAAAITQYGRGLTPVLRSGAGDYSDHVAFATAGFQACLLIEANFSNNPNYHRPTDYAEMPGYLDWNYLDKMCRSVIGYYATKLEPVEVTPRVSAIQAGTDGTMVVEVAGLPGCAYAVEMTTDLSSRIWTVIETNRTSLMEGRFVSIDPTAGTRPGGVYRARFVSGYVGAAGVPPRISLQPVSRVVDAGQAVEFGVEVIGDGPLSMAIIAMLSQGDRPPPPGNSPSMRNRGEGWRMGRLVWPGGKW